MTFIGFMINDKQELINPTDRNVLEPAIMSSDLFRGLTSNFVNFEDDYRDWKKEVMIENISTVMGIRDKGRDWDESYVLTADNCIKILAIQMRFR